MTTFAEATAVRETAPGVYAATIPDGWQQGKGAFGGVGVGVMARALLAHEAAANRPLRSLSAELCAPALPVASELHVAVLRQGASMSFLDVRLVQEGALVGHATASVGKARELDNVPYTPPSPPRPSWKDVEVAPIGPPLGPIFAQKYEFRLTGPLPFTGQSEPFVAGFIREREPPATHDAPAIIGLLDSFWPTLYVMESRPRPAVTVGYTMQLLADPTSVPTDEPLFYQARGAGNGGTYYVEMRELWSGDRLVALNQQTFALLG